VIYTESSTVTVVNIQEVVRDMDRISEPSNAFKCHKRLGKRLGWRNPAEYRQVMLSYCLQTSAKGVDETTGHWTFHMLSCTDE
jgi:hypothetical protein